MLLITHRDNPNLVINGLDYNQIDFLSNLSNHIKSNDSLEYLFYVKSQIKTVHRLEFIESTNIKYVFPIRFDIIDSKLRRYSTLDQINNFSLTIPNSVLADVHANKCKIVVDYSRETYDLVLVNKVKSTTDTVIKSTAKKYNLKSSDIILLTGNPISFTDVKEYTITTTHPGFTIKPRTTDFIQIQTDRINHLYERKYNILTLVRKARAHRLRLLEYIFVNDLRKNNLVTCSSFAHYLEENKNFFNSNFVKSLPWIYDLNNNSDFSDFASMTTKEEMLYLDSYINLSAETLFYSPFINNIQYELDVSEKTWKPIAAMQPFIVYGQPGILAYLKRLGYKTFDRWWDESYDEIIDDALRAKIIFKLYRKLSTTPKHRLALMMREMLPVLQHNQELYAAQYSSNFDNQNLMDTLGKCFDK